MITLTIGGGLAVVSAAAVQRSATAGRCHRVRIGRTMKSQTMVTVRMTLLVTGATDGSVMPVVVMEMFTRLVQ